MRASGLVRSVFLVSKIAVTALVLVIAPMAPVKAFAGHGANGSATASAVADGRIAYVRGNAIWTALADGSHQVKLSKRRASGPSWSPDGRQIAFVRESASGSRDVWIMNADGTSPRRLTRDGAVAPGAPAWSPDGSELAYAGTCIPAPDDASSCNDIGTATVLNVISTLSPNGLGTTVLSNDMYSPLDGPITADDRVAWSSDGSMIAVRNTNFPHAGDQYLLTVDVATGGVRVRAMIGYGGLEGRIGNPTFSRDGTKLAFDADITAQGEVIHAGVQVCELSDGLCDLFAQVAGDVRLAYAPSGNRVVLESCEPGRDSRLVLAGPQGTDRVDFGPGGAPSWQPITIRVTASGKVT